METQPPATWPVEPYDLLRPEAAATRLQLSRTRVFTLMRSGELRSVKIGGSRRVTLAAIADYVAELDRRGAA